MSRHHIGANARRLVGIPALLWLEDEVRNHVWGGRKQARGNARHAVLAGWILIVEPSSIYPGHESAHLIECPACGHTYRIGRNSAAWNHKWNHRDMVADDGTIEHDKFIETKFEQWFAAIEQHLKEQRK